MTASLLIDRPRPGVALLTLNRPERLNSLDGELFGLIKEALPVLDADPDVKVIVLTGAGRAFCAGHDLNEVQHLNETVRPTMAQSALRIDDEVGTLMRLRTMTTPTIAAVNGVARGGGMSIAVACDMRVMSTEATLGVGFINIDISSGDAGLSWTLPRLVGHGMAAELMLTGRAIGGAEALRIGLVNRIAAAEDVVNQALEIAEQVAEHDMTAIWMTKRTLNTSANVSLAEALTMENTAQVIAMDSDAARKRTQEFLARTRSS